MAHPAQLNFIRSVKSTFPTFFQDKKVLEVGSLDINGSVRSFFANCDYTGIDVGEGKGVDLVCEGQKYEAPESSFDVTISCECFEHNPEWKATFANMIRLAKSNSLVIMTCATTGRPEHGTTRTSPADSPLTIGKGWEYYKNLTVADFEMHFDFPVLFTSYGFSVNSSAKDLYFWGIRK